MTIQNFVTMYLLCGILTYCIVRVLVTIKRKNIEGFLKKANENNGGVFTQNFMHVLLLVTALIFWPLILCFITIALFKKLFKIKNS